MDVERRQYRRVEARIPVRYGEQNHDAETLCFGSLTGDVSAGGLRFRTKEMIAEAVNLILELDIPTLTRPIRATAKVSWIKNPAAGEYFEVGNQFLEISKKDQELVSQYVDSLGVEIDGCR